MTFVKYFRVAFYRTPVNGCFFLDQVKQTYSSPGFHKQINPYQPNVVFYIETSRLVCISYQMTGFYMKCNTELKWVNWKKKWVQIFFFTPLNNASEMLRRP